MSRKGHPLVDTRRYLPEAWSQETARLDKAGVPKTSRAYRTRHQLAWEMLAAHSAALPHRWLAGDDEMGRPSWFRQRLTALHARYLLAVPSHTALRDLETALPAERGQGRRPTRPWPSVEAWSQAVEATAWQRVDVRDGATGPLGVELIKRRVVSRNHRRQPGDEELVTVIRSRDRAQDTVVKVDYYLSHAEPETSIEELARVAKAEHRMEECLQRSQSAAGLADDEVRNWLGWQQHHTLSLLATWFLVRETERGKNMDARNHRPADSSGHCLHLGRGVAVCNDGTDAVGVPEALATP